MKIAKGIMAAILVSMCVILIIIAYFMLADIETKIPNKIESTCNIEEQEYIGRKVFIITPKEKEENKTDIVILYFHGGAYVAEATQNHWEFIEKIVIDTGATVIMPDYPLTPKYNYKDVFTMIKPLYKDIIERVDNKNLIVLGDSAGGGMALSLIQEMKEENIDMPSKTILISPWLDVRLNNPQIDEVQKRDNILNKETLKIAGIAYASEDGINNKLVNPIDGNLEKLENITIMIGTDDIFNPDTKLLKEKAKLVNTNIELKEYENAKHIWIIEKNSEEKTIEQGYNDLIKIIKNKGN